MKDEYVTVDGRCYRRGYTTGSCSAAAAKAAAYMALTGERIGLIEIDTPKGVVLKLEVREPQIEEDTATCAIQKDGGDDIDATHGLLIYAKVCLCVGTTISIEGGVGVGRVTQVGLGMAIGEAAINPIPRQMIQTEVRKVIGDSRGAQITIFVPEGERVAKKTFNPRLGIEGGISILGTTGIVEPMSDEGWKQSLALELKMKRGLGHESVVLVGGNHGERFAKEHLGCHEKYIVRSSNFVGYMLMEAKMQGYKKILMVGHIGKLIKVAAGIFHTHSRVADGRSEILVANLALLGASCEVLRQVAACTSVEGATKMIEKYGYTHIYGILAQKCQERAQLYLAPYLEDDEKIEIEAVLFALDGSLLGTSSGATVLLEGMR